MNVRYKRPRRKRQQTATKKIMNDVKKLKRAVNSAVQIKQSLTLDLGTAFNATPIVTYIPPSGKGDKTLMKYMTLRGYIRQDPASTASDVYRVDVVLDRQPAGVKATVLNIYGDATPSIGDPQDQKDAERYKILRSVIGGFDEAENGRSVKIIDFRIPLNLVATTSGGGDYTQPYINKNALYVIYWTDSTSAQPTVDMQANVYTLEDS